MHLAEFNLAKWRDPADKAVAGDFFGAIGRANQVADEAPGFVWRLKDAVDIDAFDDPSIMINLSVWETVEDLERYVWQSVHQKIYAKKHKWFGALESHHLVMWWVEEGHIPTLDEAKARLEHLNEHGNTDHAFDWSHLEHIKLWQSQRCG